MTGAVFAGRFAGKVLVVTGAAQGIGRAVALRAAAEGGRVLLVDRADFVTDVAAEAGNGAAGFTADLVVWLGGEKVAGEDPLHEPVALAPRVPRRGPGGRRPGPQAAA